MMQWSAHSCSCNSPRVLLNNLTWAVGSKITLYRHVFLLSLWCSSEIRPDHPCWHCVLTLHEMHTIMQIVLKVIKPCSSLRTPTLRSFFLLTPVQHSVAVEKTHSFGWRSEGRLVRQPCICNKRHTGKAGKLGKYFKSGNRMKWKLFWQSCICSISCRVSVYSSIYMLLFPVN